MIYPTFIFIRNWTACSVFTIFALKKKARVNESRDDNGIEVGDTDVEGKLTVGVAVQCIDEQVAAADDEPAEVDDWAQEEHEIHKCQVLGFRVKDARLRK